MGPPQPRKKTGKLIGLLAAGGAAVLVLGVIAVVALNLGSDEPDGPVRAEHCLDKRSEMTASGSMQRIPVATRVGCASDTAKAKVVKVIRTGERTTYSFGVSSMPDCPDGADGVARVTTSEQDKRYWEVCTRNLSAPHPGAPGAGGAMLGPGDCISDSIAMRSEKPCASAGWYGKVIARVQTEQECPKPRTMETAKLSGSAPRPVLCIGAGGKVLAPGDCISDPTYSFRGPQKAECGTTRAVAKVTGRVRTRQECPSGSNKVMEAKGAAYLPVLCLRQLRPTLREQLDSLTG
ncbi:hypothetical protein GCM10023085_12450 [Actinomadura viridis]|uniref:Uncharacterized protein n=1 Tax=Actinomadura viridis TaxID=58110 RepID=A0A931GP65_9ACTN|nr:hypothetical protein [Actinomadura viridis]MBG6093620.1 hypothetical protein [Actinomadura viridis]